VLLVLSQTTPTHLPGCFLEESASLPGLHDPRKHRATCTTGAMIPTRYGPSTILHLRHRTFAWDPLLHQLQWQHHCRNYRCVYLCMFATIWTEEQTDRTTRYERQNQVNIFKDEKDRTKTNFQAILPPTWYSWGCSSEKYNWTIRILPKLSPVGIFHLAQKSMATVLTAWLVVLKIQRCQSCQSVNSLRNRTCSPDAHDSR